MDALYEYFRDNGGETGFVHSKDVAEAEKEIKRYVAFRTGRVAELAKAAQPSERPGIWLSYAAQKSGAKAIATGLEMRRKSPRTPRVSLHSSRHSIRANRCW